MWNSKFKANSKQATVDGLHSSQETVEYLASKFQETCKPNSSVKSDFFESKLKKACFEYKDNVYEPLFIDINIISRVVMNLELGIPSAFDGITIEHLKFAHPCVQSILKVLFNLILDEHFVLDDFGRVVMILRLSAFSLGRT